MPVYEFDIRRFGRRIDDNDVWHAISNEDTSGLDTEFNRPADHFDVVMLVSRGRSIRAVRHADVETARAGCAVWLARPGRSAQVIGYDRRDRRAGSGFAGPLTHRFARDFVQDKIYGQLEATISRRAVRSSQGKSSARRRCLAEREQARSSRSMRAMHHARSTRFWTCSRKKRRPDAFCSGASPCASRRRRRAARHKSAREDLSHRVPSIRNEDVLKVFHAIWSGLDAAGISFACHWGQLGGFTPSAPSATTAVMRWRGRTRAINSSTARRARFLPRRSSLKPAFEVASWPG